MKFALIKILFTSIDSVNFKKNEKAYDSTNSEVFKMLQEAQNDPPEPGNLLTIWEKVQEHDQNQSLHPILENVIPQHSEPIQYPPLITLNNHRHEDSFQNYLMLASMLKYLNNGSAFAENHLED